MTTSTITPKQQSFLRKLLEDRKEVLGIPDVDAFIRDKGIDRLTITDASAFIDKVKAVSKPVDAERAHLPEGHSIINKREGFCALCGGKVEVGTGFAVAVAHRQWENFHKQGECFNEAQGLASVECGRYALPNLKGTNDLDFFIVRIKGGAKQLLRTIGGHADQTMTHAETKAHAERLASLTPQQAREAQALYGRELGVCGACGRHLTDETSRALGLGPECASKA
jgi:hypothetical protein